MKMRYLIRMKGAFVLLVLWLGLALTQSASARTRGVIDDPDGFTNVRAQPGESAAVIARVKAGEIFEYGKRSEPGSEWFSVTLSSGKMGWMHSSRIRMFVAPEDLIVAENDEANTYARADGVDYLKVIRAAAKGETAAMQQFFGMGSDGGAQETHVDMVIKLIHILGDDKMSKFLSRQSAGLQKNVAGFVTDDTALPFEQIGYMKRHFPKTARLLFDRQAGCHSAESAIARIQHAALHYALDIRRVPDVIERA